MISWTFGDLSLLSSFPPFLLELAGGRHRERTSRSAVVVVASFCDFEDFESCLEFVFDLLIRLYNFVDTTTIIYTS